MTEEVKTHKRALAKIVQIDDIIKHPNADTLDIATIGGWKVVAKSGLYEKGDMAVYCEIDSWIPHEVAPFLSGSNGPREYDGVKGERLRTVKLRGQVSQGLLMPITEVFADEHITFAIGMDVTDILGIKKWEPPISPDLADSVRGAFPYDVQKTDQERIQNLAQEISESFVEGEEFEETIKLDGTSMTVYCRLGRDGEDTYSGVAGRNMDFKVSPDAKNSLVRNAINSGLLDALTRYCEKTGRNLAFQGELIGEGIQGNKEKIKGHQFHVYDIFDMNKYVKLTPDERHLVFNEVKALAGDECGFYHVPVQSHAFKLPTDNLEDLLELADGPSLNAKLREGLVYKSKTRQFSFKIISNKWLMKNGD